VAATPTVWFAWACSLITFAHERCVAHRWVDIHTCALSHTGLFDPIEGQPYSHLDWSNVATPAHQQLALESARQSMVRAADVLGIDCASC
jgi:hypothetical protein